MTQNDNFLSNSPHSYVCFYVWDNFYDLKRNKSHSQEILEIPKQKQAENDPRCQSDQTRKDTFPAVSSKLEWGRWGKKSNREICANQHVLGGKMKVAPSSKTKHRTVSHFSAHFLYPKIQQTDCSLWGGGETEFNNRLSDTLSQCFIGLLQLGWSLFLGWKNVNRGFKQINWYEPLHGDVAN